MFRYYDKLHYFHFVVFFYININLFLLESFASFDIYYERFFVFNKESFTLLAAVEFIMIK